MGHWGGVAKRTPGTMCKMYNSYNMANMFITFDFAIVMLLLFVTVFVVMCLV